MPKFLSEIKVNLPDELGELSFQTSEDLKRWLEAEQTFWANPKYKPKNRQLISHWNSQNTFFTQAHHKLTAYENALASNYEEQIERSYRDLQSHFKQLSSGNIITSVFKIYPAIIELSKVDSDAAGLLYIATRKDSVGTLQTISQSPLLLKTLIDLILLYSTKEGSDDWLLPQRQVLKSLQEESQDELNTIRIKSEEQKETLKTQHEEAKQAFEEKENQWDTLKNKVTNEWDALKKVYDEQLALLAPTQYWNKRAKAHFISAISFAIAFAVGFITCIILFICFGIPYMSIIAKQPESSVFLALVPIVIPAFAAVWILKMLSRLLSENLQMMRDARERETMVKTFLALMYDEQNGQSIINDNDRILILHALFRPSSIAAIDDAPPVHWFDILTNKVNSSSSNK